MKPKRIRSGTLSFEVNTPRSATSTDRGTSPWRPVIQRAFITRRWQSRPRTYGDSARSMEMR